MNFIKKIALALAFFSIHAAVFPQKSAVTYTFSGGRFGDCLLAYCHAFWMAHIFDLDFLYKPFKYSDQLLMDQTDKLYSSVPLQNYKQTLHITHALQHGVLPDTLYIVPFFCESHVEHNDPRCPFLFQVDWKNQDFLLELKKRICPKLAFTTLDLPTDGISIAVHVRKGTGWDIPQFAPCFEKLTEMHPLKWPPDTYYIEQIRYIASIFPAQPLYIYLFTDHDKPDQIIEKYSQTIANPHIIWNCRDQNNRHDLNVLEDFFALTHFDCLIRNDSNFSIIASKLGNYKILIAPWDSQKIGDDEIIVSSILFETSESIQIMPS